MKLAEVRLSYHFNELYIKSTPLFYTARNYYCHQAGKPLEECFSSLTLSGNPLAMCAGLETLKTIEQPQFFPTLEQKLEAFLAPIRTAVERKKLPIAVQSAGSMFTLFFGVNKVESKEDLAQMDEERFKHFFRYLFERGVYLSPSAYEAHFLSSAHTDENLAKSQALILKYLENI